MLKLFKPLFKNKHLDISRAKELYFLNFANHTTMKRNGEFREYQKYNISEQLEHEWSLEVKDILIEDIISGKNLLWVVNLSEINLPQNIIIDAFKMLSASNNKDDIFKTIQQLKSLFDPNTYNMIIQLFT